MEENTRTVIVVVPHRKKPGEHRYPKSTNYPFNLHGQPGLRLPLGLLARLKAKDKEAVEAMKDFLRGQGIRGKVSIRECLGGRGGLFSFQKKKKGRDRGFPVILRLNLNVENDVEGDGENVE